MTKDRARKRAARDRAATTGERYVVAQRKVADSAPARTGVLDDLTHRVPGVPAHVDGGLQAQRKPTPARPAVQGHQGRQNPAHGEPQVLVGWLNGIARFFGAK